MAKKLDPYRETAQIVLEPWLVEAALAATRSSCPDQFCPEDDRTLPKKVACGLRTQIAPIELGTLVGIRILHC
jgi:hypothetical protein